MDIFSMRTRFDRLVDMEHLAVFADVVGPTERNGSVLVDNPEGLCRFLTGVAQDRIIKFERFCKTTIGISVVAACGKVSDIEFTQLLATLTE